MLILDTINQAESFTLVGPPKKRNQGKYQQFLIEYPQYHKSPEALRPHLQLDLAESVLLDPPIELSLSSLYASTMNAEKEISNISCVTIESTASEKFVSLLRKTALYARDNSRQDDETLIRHIYDLHLIYKSITEPSALKNMVQKVINIDRKQFGNQHPEFMDDAIAELKYGLSILIEQPLHKDRYERFVGPLVHHPAPADWKEAIKSIQILADHWL